MRPMTSIIALASTALVLALGCEQQGSSAQAPAGGSQSAGAPAWVLTSEPANAQSITDAKRSAAEGDEVVVRGYIGGTMHPIASNSPVLRIIDTGLVNKCTSEDDHCATPWDYCCAAREDLVANAATVQLTGADGSPFAGDPTAAGLSPLDEIVVVGRVGPRPTVDVLTIVTTGVYRVEN